MEKKIWILIDNQDVFIRWTSPDDAEHVLWCLDSLNPQGSTLWFKLPLMGQDVDPTIKHNKRFLFPDQLFLKNKIKNSSDVQCACDKIPSQEEWPIQYFQSQVLRHK